MLKAAFCDDASALDGALGFLDRYRGERGLEIAHTSFRSPVDLLAEIEQGERFDILFLDILMPGQNGIETAAEIPVPRGKYGEIRDAFLEYAFRNGQVRL